MYVSIHSLLYLAHLHIRIYSNILNNATIFSFGSDVISVRKSIDKFGNKSILLTNANIKSYVESPIIGVGSIAALNFSSSLIKL